MPPIVKSSTEEIKEIIESTAKKTAEQTREEILKHTRDEKGQESGSKMSQILKGATQTTDTEKVIEESRKERERLEKEMHDNEILCPTCQKGHIHILKGTGDGKVKCTGDKCGTEYTLIPEDADYKCDVSKGGCGLPHRKPIEQKENDKCPFCGNENFMKYDWSRIKKKID